MSNIYRVALAKAPSRRSRMPIRRNSREAGKCEGTFWRRTNRQDMRRIVLAARRFEVANKERGKRNGPLGAVAIEVLDLLANMVDYRSGRLEPSIETMMGKLRRSRDAIVRALKALRTHGFVDWLRRFIPTHNDGAGPQLQQTSNAYRLMLPARAEASLGRYGNAPPPSDDAEVAVATREAMFDEYRKTLEANQLALFEVGDNPIGRALARLGGFIKQRESAKRTETKSRFNIIEEEKRTPLFGPLTRPCGGSDPR
ncbi:helix-turn-helix domain-containing protein [Rhizobium sp. CFBP 8762]|uniref:helix-turn-helix domain-containing protein n=1 Tax=Rhizobium sp. CFBP 8762 TaxID=2775279 RepID=UPI00177C6E04|nr:helix-turn-helix domain-containing protein [Rhizobium sp. CFBP 8762]MBD8555162.1 helix-turn-helix domain-containing protein [Rhizobium sp. CFBP 8762]